MPTRQRKCRLCMIERGRLPHNVGMTGNTIMRELICHMIRRHDIGKISLMATVTIGRQSYIAAIGVA